MLIWFAATSVVLVAIVFKSPGVDYRYVAAGALLPLLEALTGGPKVLHSLLGAGLMLVVVVLATQRRRLLRRKVLGIPIGVMAHLVLDGSFARTDVFWWPVSGRSFASGQIPEIDHLTLSLLLEVIGVGVAWWAYRLFRLNEPARRDRFVATGRLDLPDEA